MQVIFEGSTIRLLQLHNDSLPLLLGYIVDFQGALALLFPEEAITHLRMLLLQLLFAPLTRVAMLWVHHCLSPIRQDIAVTIVVSANTGLPLAYLLGDLGLFDAAPTLVLKLPRQIIDLVGQELA